jgi:hypothetical protein
MRSSIRAAAVAVLLSGPTLGAERVAVFEAELHDTSGEGVIEAQQQRLRLVTEELRRVLAASGRYEVVDTAPVAARVAEGPTLRSCPTCAPDAAAVLGADLALVTVVNKVSNLILSITLVEMEAGGARRAVHSAEIRGNNDESWLRGLRWLIRNRLLAPPRP